MINYSYYGKNKQGEASSGELLAESMDDVSKKLMAIGIFPIKIEEKKSKNKSGGKIKKKELIIFTRQLYVLVKSGVPIVRALGSMETSSKNEKLKELFRDIKSSIESGSDLFSSLQKHDKIFDVFYLNMIKVGEATGKLEEVLLELYDYIHFEEEMKIKAKSAVRYPLTVIAVMAIALTIMMTMVIPTFADVYKGFGAKLPWPTLLLISISNFMINFGIYLLIGLGFFINWLKGFLQTGAGKIWWDEYKINIPIVGPILRKSLLARFSKSFTLAIKAGIPIVQSLGIISKVINNLYFEKKIEQMQMSIEKGNSLYNAMSLVKGFDDLVLEMVSTGEESGSLDIMLKEVSTMYDEDIDYDLKMLSSQIEPILLAVIAGMVLIFALGIFLPIWDLGSVVMKKS